jgi:hypothetical protein
MRRALTSEGTRLANAWRTFWFAPRPTSSLALFRIVYGLLVALWALALLGDAGEFLGPTGVLPEHPDTRWTRIGLLGILTSNFFAVAVVVTLVILGLLLAAGLFTKLMSIINFVLLLSIARRNPEMVNSGDSLLRHFGFFLMFAPAGEALSVDRWRRARADFWSAPARSPWAFRLLQIQVTFVYFFSTFAKARGEEWTDGTALAEIWRAGDTARFELPMFLYDSMLASNLGTFGTLVIELALATLIWNRAARPYVIAAGLLLHAGIEATLTVGFFSIVVCSGYLTFVPEERASALFASARTFLERRAAVEKRRSLELAGLTVEPTDSLARSPEKQ